MAIKAARSNEGSAPRMKDEKNKFPETGGGCSSRSDQQQYLRKCKPN